MPIPERSTTALGVTGGPAIVLGPFAGEFAPILFDGEPGAFEAFDGAPDVAELLAGDAHMSLLFEGAPSAEPE